MGFRGSENVLCQCVSGLSNYRQRSARVCGQQYVHCAVTIRRSAPPVRTERRALGGACEHSHQGDIVGRVLDEADLSHVYSCLPFSEGSSAVWCYLPPQDAEIFSSCVGAAKTQLDAVELTSWRRLRLLFLFNYFEYVPFKYFYPNAGAASAS